jgi:hypothetical protein
MEFKGHSQMEKFYLVFDNVACWGAGKTETEAIAHASEFVENEYGEQGLPVAEMAKLIKTKDAVNESGDGFYVLEMTEHWPPNIDNDSSESWLRHVEAD